MDSYILIWNLLVGIPNVFYGDCYHFQQERLFSFLLLKSEALIYIQNTTLTPNNSILPMASSIYKVSLGLNILFKMETHIKHKEKLWIENKGMLGSMVVANKPEVQTSCP